MAEKQQHYNQQPPPYSAATNQVYPDLSQHQSAHPQYAGYSGNAQHHTYQPSGEPFTIIVNRERFGPFPSRTSCPLCKADIVTETYSEAGLLAWLLGGGLCLIGCWFGCCLIPCCINSTRDVVHKCPQCKQNIGLYKRL